MPQMDGFEVAALIRQDCALRESAVVMLTSADSRGDAARYGELGIKAHLSKPVKRAELLEAIRLALMGPGEVTKAEKMSPPPRLTNGTSGSCWRKTTW